DRGAAPKGWRRHVVRALLGRCTTRAGWRQRRADRRAPERARGAGVLGLGLSAPGRKRDRDRALRRRGRELRGSDQCRDARRDRATLAAGAALHFGRRRRGRDDLRHGARMRVLRGLSGRHRPHALARRRDLELARVGPDRPRRRLPVLLPSRAPRRPRRPATSGARLALLYHSMGPSRTCDPAYGCFQVDVKLTTSANGGATWTQPRLLNAFPMLPAWMADPSLGRMLGDYVSVSWTGGRPIPWGGLAPRAARGPLPPATVP